eukprot:scaffold10470_cov124-Isochrysis_galbana.AAC.3
MTAAYRFEPQYCRREFDASEVGEVRQVLRSMATKEHAYANMLAELAEYEEAARSARNGEPRYDHKALAFSERAQRMPGYQWAKVYMAAWPSLRVAAMRLLSLSCSASACEHSWSIEGWIHSKKRNSNRMG